MLTRNTLKEHTMTNHNVVVKMTCQEAKSEIPMIVTEEFGFNNSVLIAEITEPLESISWPITAMEVHLCTIPYPWGNSFAYRITFFGGSRCDQIIDSENFEKTYEAALIEAERLFIDRQRVITPRMMEFLSSIPEEVCGESMDVSLI